MPQALAAATLPYENCNDTLTLNDGCPRAGYSDCGCAPNASGELSGAMAREFPSSPWSGETRDILSTWSNVQKHRL